MCWYSILVQVSYGSKTINFEWSCFELCSRGGRNKRRIHQHNPWKPQVLTCALVVLTARKSRSSELRVDDWGGYLNTADCACPLSPCNIRTIKPFSLHSTKVVIRDNERYEERRIRYPMMIRSITRSQDHRLRSLKLASGKQKTQRSCGNPVASVGRKRPQAPRKSRLPSTAL